MTEQLEERRKKNITAGIVLNVLITILGFLLVVEYNRAQSSIDTNTSDINGLKQQAVKWNIMADDVKDIKTKIEVLPEMRADMKTLLRRP